MGMVGTPLPFREREGPAAKRWEGEGHGKRQKTLTLPSLSAWAPPSPLQGEGLC
jgi:hypothetical protein